MAPPTPGYQVATHHLRTFAGGMDHAGDRIGGLQHAVPKFGAGWSDFSSGIPEVGKLLFLHRYNSISDIMGEALQAFGTALTDGGGRLVSVAAAYDIAEAKVVAGGKQIPVHTP